MNFSIDYDKLGDMGKYLIDKSKEIDDLYSELVDICISIDDNWKSEDSSVYLWKMVAFLKEIIKDNDQIVGTGELLNKLSQRYNDADNKWDKDLLREEQEKNEQ